MSQVYGYEGRKKQRNERRRSLIEVAQSWSALAFVQRARGTSTFRLWEGAEWIELELGGCEAKN